MYELNINEKLSDIPDAQEYSLLPDGDYVCQIADALPKTTKNGLGKYLSVKYRVEKGPLENRTISQNINFKNESKQCENIGKSQLKQLTLACCLPEIPASSDQFIARSVIVTVGTKDGRNEVKKVKSLLAVNSVAPEKKSEPWG